MRKLHLVTTADRRYALGLECPWKSVLSTSQPCQQLVNNFVVESCQQLVNNLTTGPNSKTIALLAYKLTIQHGFLAKNVGLVNENSSFIY